RGALSPSVLGPKDTTPRVRQVDCCTAESRPPPPTGLWQRWSSVEMLSLSISRLLFSRKTDAPTPSGTPPWPRRDYRPRRRLGRASARARAPEGVGAYPDSRLVGRATCRRNGGRPVRDLDGICRQRSGRSGDGRNPSKLGLLEHRRGSIHINSFL